LIGAVRHQSVRNVSEGGRELVPAELLDFPLLAHHLAFRLIQFPLSNKRVGRRRKAAEKQTHNDRSLNNARWHDVPPRGDLTQNLGFPVAVLYALPVSPAMSQLRVAAVLVPLALLTLGHTHPLKLFA
jgi:hypothetical protein